MKVFKVRIQVIVICNIVQSKGQKWISLSFLIKCIMEAVTAVSIKICPLYVLLAHNYSVMSNSHGAECALNVSYCEINFLCNSYMDIQPCSTSYFTPGIWFRENQCLPNKTGCSSGNLFSTCTAWNYTNCLNSSH